MLTKIKHLVNSGQDNLLIIAVIVLIVLSSFGAGWLLSVKPYYEPIIIYEPTGVNLQDSFCLPVGTAPSAQNSNIANKLFVGSINSNKYHHPDCPWAQKISPDNQIWFSSEQEAQNAGYMPCGNLQNVILKEQSN